MWLGRSENLSDLDAVKTFKQNILHKKPVLYNHFLSVLIPVFFFKKAMIIFNLQMLKHRSVGILCVQETRWISMRIRRSKNPAEGTGRKSYSPVCSGRNLQPWTKYSRKTLVFIEIAHYGKSSRSLLLVMTIFFFFIIPWSFDIILNFPNSLRS